MVIVRDTRDKTSKHKNVDDYLTSVGYTLVRSKLYVGDVALLNNQSVSVDLKQNLQEIVGNVCQQHERFSRECQKAKDAGIKLIFLCEHGGNITSLESVKNWYNPRLKVSPYALSGERLYKIMLTYQAKYGVEWMFCNKRETGRVVEKILLGVHSNSN